MSEKWPKRGENVIATVTRIVPYGAYARLEEYEGLEGFVHISEISSSWVRNIRNFLREGQRTVFKVVRIDKGKAHIDLSFKRTTEGERRAKLSDREIDRRGRILLGIVADRLGRDSDEMYKSIAPLIEEEFETLFDGFKEAAEKGVGGLKAVSIPEKVKRVLADVARENVKLRRVRVAGTLKLASFKPNGVETVREAVRRAKEVGDVKIYVAGCPNYRIEVEGDNYKEVEGILKGAATKAVEYIQGEGGEGAFIRKSK